MTLILNRFKTLHSKTGIIPYIIPEYPNAEIYEKIFSTLGKEDVTLIEVGMPFSDPIADGATISKASRHAIAQGVTLEYIMNSIQDFKNRFPDIPVIVMGYYNVIHNIGEQKFCDQLKKYNIDGFLIVDLPIEESFSLRKYAKDLELCFVQLMTPNTKLDRMKHIISQMSEYDMIYYVSLSGVTGDSQSSSLSLDLLNEIRNYTNLPIISGFGISSPENAARYKDYANGVVIGTKIIDIINESLTKKDSLYSWNEASLIQFLNSIKLVLQDK